jgi:hypothetical protein
MAVTTKQIVWGRMKKWLVLVVIFYGIILVGGIRDFWECYWLKQDANETMAVVTKERQHGIVEYRYSVAQHEYTGSSQRNWKREEYRDVRVGEKAPVFYSVSHPSLSSLQTPMFPPRSTLFYLVPPLVLAVAAVWSVREPRKSHAT